MSDVQTIQNYIAGQFQQPASQKYMDSFNPATGKVLCLVPESSSLDVDLAVRAAEAAFPEWSKFSRTLRSKLLHRLADTLEGELEDFALAESDDQGKTIRQALDVEMPRCVANLRYFANLILDFHGYTTEMDAPGVSSVSTVRHEPIGVVSIITPWNLPLYLLTWKMAPALAMGNCVVAKPSEYTSLTAFKLASLIARAGFPPGVINLVFGRGDVVGRALVEHPGVAAISFTGGTVTGRKIAQMAAATPKKVSLELGGKNAAVVFADCDLQSTVETCIRSSFANQGEICLCSSRIYVERTIYEKFREMFVSGTAALKVGNPRNPATYMGALVSREHQKKVLSYIETAKRENLTILHQGNVLSEPGLEEGNFVPPIIIENPPPNSPLEQEEIFGPIVCISPFDGELEAIQRANGVRYGLSACVWSRDVSKCERVARQIKAGVVWINCWMVRDLATPFGGVKESGYGREGGRYSLEFFSNVKTVTAAI